MIRRQLGCTFLTVSGVVAAVLPPAPALAGERDGTRWVVTWATGPAGRTPDAIPQFDNQTVRYIVHT
ncbi:MAG: hypothetical protein ACRENC_09720, partial [Gemmatimonadaceae bacterium]